MIFVLYNFVTDDFQPGLSERVVLDKKRTTAENVREVLVNICSRQNGPNDSKKVIPIWKLKEVLYPNILTVPG